MTGRRTCRCPKGNGRGAPRPLSMKASSPLGQGGTSGGFRSGLSGQPCHDNPLKASRPPSCSRPHEIFSRFHLRLLSPLLRGIFLTLVRPSDLTELDPTLSADMQPTHVCGTERLRSPHSASPLQTSRNRKDRAMRLELKASDLNFARESLAV